MGGERVVIQIIMDENQLLEKGKELFGKGMFLQAIEFFQVAIDSNSNAEEAYLLLADTYSQLGKDALAKSVVYKYLSINPSSKTAIQKIQSLDSENYTSSSSSTCDIKNMSFGQMTKEQKEQYLESLVERNVSQEKMLGIESVHVSIDVRSDEDIYYYIEIEGAIKDDVCLDVIIYGDNRKIFDKNTEWIPDYVFSGSQTFWMQLKGISIDRIRKIKVVIRNAIRLH